MSGAVILLLSYEDEIKALSSKPPRTGLKLQKIIVNMVHCPSSFRVFYLYIRTYSVHII